jgi:hypothetical protein
MITVTQCAAFAGLASDELILGVTPSAKHRLLLLSYLLNLDRGPMAVRDMIIADLRRFRELGALQPTADLLLVLRFFLTDYPDARCVQKRNSPCKRKSETRAGDKSGGHGERIEAATTEIKSEVIELAPRSHPANESGDGGRIASSHPPRRQLMSRSPTMRLSKRASFAIAFAGISAMAGPGMTRAIDPASPLTVKPLQGVSFDIGTKRAVSYFLSGDNACKLTLMLAEVAQGDEVNGLITTRMMVAVESGKAVHLDAADGKSLEFKCQAGAHLMSIGVSDQATHWYHPK